MEVTSHLFLCLVVCLQSIQAEIFTSMADMEQMVLSEKQMLSELKNYLDSEEQKLSDIKQFLARLDSTLENVNETDVGKYLGNPVNSYLMLKRFNVDWKLLEKRLETDLAETFNNVYENMKPFFPTTEDHTGAIDALFRLQTTYKLRAASLAKGIIPGVKGVSTYPLKIEEIFDIGQRAYNTKNWPYAIEWLKVALDEFGENYEINGIRKDDVMDYLAFSMFQEGELRPAYKLTQQLAKIRPDDQRIQDNIDYFKKEMHRLELSRRGDMGEAHVELSDIVKEPVSARESRKRSVDDYEKLCRGEVRALTKKEQRKMKCWYRQKHPILRLKPQRVERKWANPEILEFHNMLSEEQIRWIKKTAHPKLSRATIQDPLTGKLRYADYRVSKSAWLNPKRYPMLMKLQKRAEAVTGLDIDYAEDLQIANYGIGGHYEPHFDHAREEEDKFSDLNMGNRIATILMYTSDVLAGGATVFTKARTAVWPKRGSAVFWYNLKRNGKGNPITRHAACPVLVGQKWVSNWWIHEYGQLHKRPCALNENV